MRDDHCRAPKANTRTLLLVMDASGAKHNPQLQIQKSVIRGIVESSSKDERLGIIAYTDRATVLLTPTFMNYRGKREALSIMKDSNSQEGSADVKAALDACVDITTSANTHVLLMCGLSPARGRQMSRLVDQPRQRKGTLTYVQLLLLGHGLPPQSLVASRAVEKIYSTGHCVVAHLPNDSDSLPGCVQSFLDNSKADTDAKVIRDDARKYTELLRTILAVCDKRGEGSWYGLEEGEVRLQPSAEQRRTAQRLVHRYNNARPSIPCDDQISKVLVEEAHCSLIESVISAHEHCRHIDPEILSTRRYGPS